MTREHIRELALDAARDRYHCKECRKAARCTFHGGALLPKELHCAASDYAEGYAAGYEDGLPFYLTDEEDDGEPDYYEVYE